MIDYKLVNISSGVVTNVKSDLLHLVLAHANGSRMSCYDQFDIGDGPLWYLLRDRRGGKIEHIAYPESGDAVFNDVVKKLIAGEEVELNRITVGCNRPWWVLHVAVAIVAVICTLMWMSLLVHC